VALAWRRTVAPGPVRRPVVRPRGTAGRGRTGCTSGRTGRAPCRADDRRATVPCRCRPRPLARHEVPVDDIARVPYDGDVAARLQRVLEGVMRRDTATARVPCLVKEQRTGADARDPGGVGPPDPVDQNRVGHLAPGALTTRHEQDVQRRMVAERMVGQHPEPLAAAHGAGSLSDGHRGVRAVAEHGRRGEHLPRPDEVQFLDTVEHHQSIRGHAYSLVDLKRSR
jgi:hypothetical protein